MLDVLASELKLQLDEKDIELQLPQDPPTIVFDRTRLYQILSNLIGNAVRHMDRTTGSAIHVDIDERDGGWQIAVQDDGPGIPRAYRDRIFEAFQTVDVPSRNATTCGLGLAIVKKIVDTHGGRISLESEVGAGSRFVVWLPRT